MPRPAPSVSRVVALMNLLGEHPGEFITLSEIARRLSLNKATAHGILTALTDANFVIRQPVDNGYSLGPGIVRVGRAALSRAYEMVALARREMETLAEESNAQCVASAVESNQVIVIAATGTPAGPIGGHVGGRARHLPPVGMVFMAWASDDEINDWLGAGSLEDAERQHYRELLTVVRERGFSTSAYVEERVRLEAAVDGLLHRVVDPEVRETLVGLMAEFAHETRELPEIHSDRRYRLRQITAPIFDENGVVRIGLSLTGLPEISGEQLRDYGYALRAAASRVSRRTGGRPPTGREIRERDSLTSGASA
jgi:DNA-binding IclR family transcriptional regulator